MGEAWPELFTDQALGEISHVISVGINYSSLGD